MLCLCPGSAGRAEARLLRQFDAATGAAPLTARLGLRRGPCRDGGATEFLAAGSLRVPGRAAAGRAAAGRARSDWPLSSPAGNTGPAAAASCRPGWPAPRIALRSTAIRTKPSSDCSSPAPGPNREFDAPVDDEGPHRGDDRIGQKPSCGTPGVVQAPDGNRQPEGRNGQMDQHPDVNQIMSTRDDHRSTPTVTTP